MDVDLQNQTLDGLIHCLRGFTPCNRKGVTMKCEHMEKVRDLAKLRDTLLNLTIYNPDKHYDELETIEYELATLIPRARICVTSTMGFCTGRNRR